jgi:hypothetical protein
MKKKLLIFYLLLQDILSLNIYKNQFIYNDFKADKNKVNSSNLCIKN